MFKINTLKSFGKLAMTAVIAFAASVPALAWEYSDFIELGEPTLSQVAFAPSVGSETPDYSSFPYWVGSFHYFFTLKIYGMQIPSDFVVPDDLVCKMSVHDAYGNYILDADQSAVIKRALTDPLLTDQEIYTQINQINIDLGGYYVFNAYLNFMNWDRTFNQEIHDPASVRVFGDPEPRLGENMDFNVFFNTGYPYDIASYSGNENVNYRFEYKAPKSTESVHLTSGNLPLTFAQSTTPLRAVRDSLHLFVEKPSIGYYVLSLESDTWPVANNKEYEFIVSDTVRADASIDRDVIDLDKDHEINASAWVNYGFPYIPAVKPDSDTIPYDTVPTVRFITTMKYSYNPNLAIRDTLAVVDPAFGENDIDLSRDMKIDLNKIVRDSLTNEFSPFVNVEVNFNGKRVFDKNFNLTIVNTPSAVEEVVAVLPESRRGIYNIMGVKMNVPFEQLPRGIYIVDGKKIAKR